MKLKLFLSAALILMVTSLVSAQRPRTITNDDAPAAAPTQPPPTTFKAKYEGGVFGYNRKMNGTLTFDDANNRFVFRDEKQKEQMFFPYDSLTGAYGDTHSVQPKSATIASHVPYIGLPAQFIRNKVEYLTIQYNDPDSKVSGMTSFKVAYKKLLASVLAALAAKAGLTQRGEIYIKKN